MRNIYRLLSMLVVFGTAGLVLHFFPVGGEFDVDITGWGWGVAVVTMIVGAVISSYAAGFVSGLLGESSKNPVMRFIGKVIGYVGYAAIFLAIAPLFPGLITISSPVAFLWFMGVLGIAFAADDLVEARYFPKVTTTK